MALSIDEAHPSHTNNEQLLNALFFLLLGLVIFFALYMSVKSNDYLIRFDRPVLDWMMAHRTPTFTTIMQIVTSLASPATFIVVTLVGSSLWAFFKKELWRPALLIGAMATSSIASTVIKSLVERSRPPTAAMIPPLETDYSFPSGHTIGIAVFLFVLSYLLYSRTPSAMRFAVFTFITIVGIGLVAVSRLYLAYHWVTDVSASIGLAFIILAVVIIIDFIFQRRK